MDIVPGFLLLLCLSYSASKHFLVETKARTQGESGIVQEHEKHTNIEVEEGEDYMNPDDTVDEDTDGKEDFTTTDEEEDVTPVTNKKSKAKGAKKEKSGYWI